jgi:hypothetical protein
MEANFAGVQDSACLKAAESTSKCRSMIEKDVLNCITPRYLLEYTESCVIESDKTCAFV